MGLFIDKIFSDIKKKVLPCYFIVDPPHFFSDLIIEELKKIYLKEKKGDDSFHFFDKDDLNIESIFSELNTGSLFSPKRLVVFKNTDRFNKDCVQKFVDFLKQPPAQCCLVFVAEKSPKHALYQYCKSTQCEFVFKQPYESQMLSWVQWIAQKENKNIDAAASYVLLSKVGSDLLRLKKEIEKISLALAENKNIESDDIQKILFSTRTYSIFELLSAIGFRKRNNALVMASKMMEEGESEIFIFSMIVRHLKQIWKALEWERTKSDTEVQRALGIHPFFWDAFQKQKYHYQKFSFEKMWKHFLHTERILKTMNVDKQTELFFLINKLCSSK